MHQVRKYLLAIFYFPLVILTFTLFFSQLFSFDSFFSSWRLKLMAEDGSFKARQEWAYFQGKQIPAPTSPLLIASEQTKGPAVLAETSDEKWIDINLATQTLTAFEPNGQVFMQVPVSTGLWASTPTGSYRIWIKLRYTLMHGGSQATGTYYYLPNVPCTQYFYKGYGVHGTYWHNNFGHPMSHGCVNMYTPDACRLFEWTSPPIASNINTAYPTAENPGTKVVIHY